jgi:hypothetical protein
VIRALREPTPYGVWLATCLVMGVLIAGGFWLYSRLQVARVDAIERLCLRDNEHARENIAFIRAVSPQVTAKALDFFKVEPSCHAYAQRVARQPPPQP